MRAAALDIRFARTESEHRDMAAATLLDFETAAVHEIDDACWRVFFRSFDERDRAVRALSVLCEVTPTDVEDEDWARRSQRELKAVQVGDLIIAPPWDVPEDARQDVARDRIIIIEPSTGFGTGHHATTRLCLLALQQVDLHGKRVLDVGTGSGVLALAAARLGAATVTALDSDSDALVNARDNARRTGVEVDWRAADLESDPLPRADVVLANITGGMLRAHAPALAAAAQGGALIVSGLLSEEEASVRGAFLPFAVRMESLSEDGWVALTLAIRRSLDVC